MYLISLINDHAVDEFSRVILPVLNYILSCIKFVTFGSVPELVADGWLEREKAACIRNQQTVASGTTYTKHLPQELPNSNICIRNYI